MGRKYKRKGRRRRRRAKKNMLVAVARNPIAPSALVKMRYCTTVKLDAAANSSAQNLFRANSLWDPDYTNGGSNHQPIGFDQWMTFYDHFAVLGSKITVDFVSQATVNAPANVHGVFITVSDTSSPVTTLETIREQGNAAYGVLTGSAATGKLRLRKNFSTKRFFNRADVKDCSELRGSGSGDCSEVAFYVVGTETLDPSRIVNPDAIYASITIDYIALLTEPKQLAQS